MAQDEKRAKETGELPDGLHFHDLDKAFAVWRVLRWTDWRWSPSDVLNQEDALLEDIAQLQWYYGLVKDSLSPAAGTVIGGVPTSPGIA